MFIIMRAELLSSSLEKSGGESREMWQWLWIYRIVIPPLVRILVRCAYTQMRLGAVKTGLFSHHIWLSGNNGHTWASFPVLATTRDYVSHSGFCTYACLFSGESWLVRSANVCVNAKYG